MTVASDPRGHEGPMLGLAQREAIAEDLLLLARVHDREPDAAMIAALRATSPDQWLSLQMAGVEYDAAMHLLAEGLAGLRDPVTSAELDALAAEFAALYLTYGYHITPTESPWRDEDGLERQQAMFAVRAWYRHHGLRIDDWRTRSDDHLVYELQFVAHVLRRSADAEDLREMARFLRAHPLAWVPHFAARTLKRCRQPLFAGFALLTSVYLARLADVLGTIFGLDMTPAPLRPEAKAGGPAPTCADAPPAIYGGAPGW